MNSVVPILATSSGGDSTPGLLTAKRKRLTPYMQSFNNDFVDLIEGSRFGHMAEYEYANGNWKLWQKFVEDGMQGLNGYYVPLQELNLLREKASEVAKLLKDKGINTITLVSRGPGTQFSSKEGALITAFQAAGINTAKVVYIEHSTKGRATSMAHGKELLPNAVHQAIDADMFDPKTKALYEVVGTEVGTCFGLTHLNAEGAISAATPPISSVIKNVKGIRGQQKKGSINVMTYDHTDDPDVLENMFFGGEHDRTEMARNMLRHHLNIPEEDSLSDVELISPFSPQSMIVGQTFCFQKDRPVEVGGLLRVIPAGSKLQFNNAVKLEENIAEDVNMAARYSYPIKPQSSSFSKMSMHVLEAT